MEEATKCECESCYDEHSCPFLAEIHDDCETLCTCCSHCEGVCAQEV